jgi:hypothetical protein
MTHFVEKRKALFLAICLVSLALTTHGESQSPSVTDALNRHTFFVDASGSMRPYYTDARPQFVELLAGVVGSVTSPGDEVAIYSFSKNDPKAGISSPSRVVNGTLDRGGIGGVSIEDILSELRYFPAGNTDLSEAVDAGKSSLGDTGGFIWILTDNIQDPENRLDSLLIQSFYDKLRNDKLLRRINAFPINLQFPGCKNLPLLYGIFYSTEPVSDVMAVFEDNSLKKISNLTAAPLVHCKPLIRDAFSIVYSGGKIELDNVKEGDRSHTPVRDIKLRSHLPSHNISSPDIRAELQFHKSEDESVPLGKMSQNVFPKSMDVDPGETSEERYRIDINLPAINPDFSFASCFKSGFAIYGMLKIRADSVSFSLYESLSTIMRNIYGGSAMPEFFHPTNVGGIRSKNIPVIVHVKYSFTRTLLGLGIPLLIFALIAAVIYYIMTNPQRYEIAVDGDRQSTRALRWNGDKFDVKADEDVGRVVIGTVKYFWFRGLFFIVRSPYRLAGETNPKVKLPDKTYEFLVEKEEVTHNVRYAYIGKKQATKGQDRSPRKRYV